MTVTTPVADAVASATRADADKRYEDAARDWQEAIDNSNKSLGSANAGTLATYAANKAASIANSHKAGAV
jgi:hypothetical protein